MDTNPQNPRTVVVVLPIKDDTVLLQLRDPHKEISFAGHWGFFGGHLEPNETPEECAKRELVEEIGFLPRSLRHISSGFVSELEILCHAYCCELTVPLSTLIQNEGSDMKLVSHAEFKQRTISSERLSAEFPTVPGDFIAATFLAALKK